MFDGLKGTHEKSKEILTEVVLEISSETGIALEIVEDIIQRFKSKVGKRVKEEILVPIMNEQKLKLKKITGEKDGGKSNSSES